jgi:hypothetical protein
MGFLGPSTNILVILLTFLNPLAQWTWDLAVGGSSPNQVIKFSEVCRGNNIFCDKYYIYLLMFNTVKIISLSLFYIQNSSLIKNFDQFVGIYKAQTVLLCYISSTGKKIMNSYTHREVMFINGDTLLFHTITDSTNY